MDVAGGSGVFETVFQTDPDGAYELKTPDDSVRGRVVGLYSMAVSGGFACGPLVLSLTGSENVTPFLVSGAVMLLAALPLLPVLRIAPRLDGHCMARYAALCDR